MRITRMVEALHVLPYSGGLFEQPSGVVFKIEAIFMASQQPETAQENYEQAKAKIEERLSSGGIRRT